MSPTGNAPGRLSTYHAPSAQISVLPGKQARTSPAYWQVLVDLETLAELVQGAVERAIEGRLASAIRAGTTKPYLTIEDVCQLTGLSKRQLAYRRKSGSIPFFKRGRKVLFETALVYRWIEEGRVPASRGGQSS